MNLDDLKDSLREAFGNITSRIAESPAWHQLTEKYSDLPPQGQKAALAGGAFLATMILLSVPSCVLMTSSSNLQEFEDRKQLMRDMYRINREVSSMPPPPAPFTVSDLQNRAQNEISMAGLQPDQLGGVSVFDNKPIASSWIPKQLDQQGVNVVVRKLNLQQIVGIGQRLQNMQATAKMTGLEVRAQTADPHYFDVTYKLVAFNLPLEASKNTDSKKR